ncbi:MAG: DUF3971 domain-containing protein [Beijerinckiaceae bacterium]
MAGLMLLGLFLLLSGGPVSTPFLTERVAAALEGRLGEHIDVKVGETKLERTADGLEFHVYDVVFRDLAGKEILRSPEALIGFDPLQLAALKIAPRRLALKGMAMKAEIRPDGEARLTTGGAAGAAPPARLDEALAFLVTVARTGTLSGLSELSLRDASLVINDQRVGKDIAFDKVSAVFEAPAPGSAVVRGVMSRAGAAIPFRLNADTAGAGAKVSLVLQDMPLRVAETVGGLHSLPISGDSKATLQGELVLDVAAKPVSGRLDASLSPGSISVPALFNGPVTIDEAKLSAVWSGAADRIESVRLNYAGDGSKGALAGVLHMPSAERLEYRFEGQTEGLVLAPVAARDRPLEVTQGILTARATQALDLFTLDALTLDGPETAIKLTGQVKKAEGGAAARLELSTGRMPVRAALAWWPGSFGAGGKTYLAGAVQDGTLGSLSILLDLTPPALRAMIAQESIPAEALKLDVAVDNASILPLDGLPPITGLAGGGQLNAQTAQFSATRGAMDLKGQSKRILLSDGVVQLTKLDTLTPDIVIGFRAQTTAENAAEFLTLPALKDVFALQANPQDIRGQFDGRARIAFPLGRTLAKGDIVTEATATLKGVSIDKAIGKDRLENASLTIAADKTGVEIKGEGRWQGIPVTIGLENDAQTKSSATVLSFTLDDAAQKRIGLSGGFTGPLPVKIKAQRPEGGAMKAQTEIDLTRANIDGAIPGFQKPAGRPGKVTFEAVERPRGYTLQNFALESGAASLRGQAEVQQDGTLVSARFNLFRLSPGDNVRLDFDRVGAVGKVVIRGNNFDSRPFLRTALQDGGGGGRGERDIDIDLKTTLLSGHGGEVLTSAELRLQRRGGQTRQLAVTGKLNGKNVNVSGQAADRTAPINIETDDAGALLRYLDIYTRMAGGDLQAQVRPGARDTSGYFIARNFSQRNEPALRRLMSEGQGQAGGAGEFTKMRLDFSRAGSATTIKDAVIFGPQLGITFNGIVDQSRDRVSMSGTYVPAYGLNNAFAQIPVLGNILAGGRNEGLLAITFGVSGRASNPEVQVNPLSAVTPGIFRKIFEFRNDRTGTTGAAGPAVRSQPPIDQGSR